MIQKPNSKQYDLEERTYEFAFRVRNFIKKLTKTMGNIEDGSQLIRSSGSVGANYIEANESLSKKDFLVRIKICRKEAKVSRYWLKLVDVGSNFQVENERKQLVEEATELLKIFNSIVQKSE